MVDHLVGNGGGCNKGRIQQWEIKLDCRGKFVHVLLLEDCSNVPDCIKNQYQGGCLYPYGRED